MSSIRDDIFAACPEVTPVPFDVPEWGRTVHVRPMTGDELVTLFTSSKAGDRDPLLLTIYSVCDEAGAFVFSPADLPELRKRSGVPFLRIAHKAIEINGLKDADAKND